MAVIMNGRLSPVPGWYADRHGHRVFLRKGEPASILSRSGPGARRVEAGALSCSAPTAVTRHGFSPRDQRRVPSCPSQHPEPGFEPGLWSARRRHDRALRPVPFTV